ncbi:hypothetical protein, unlikely [Trypanosoma brucei gambiense DAL972]|uniref:Uncharacterized protein n=1 Tax=Trypanosoma brucei gambiense (strain MHOM/CI/86/DAL972) TaxID=679716 RepID=C9ZRS6_TRYB9|nr:hypothetical protein, unlikely [Trypanosoma brucei gambiense DAL972]CBH12062.1 hypothetical protein, unlikely [Trypanosoma brucei gambiense DAL972]|eukprot:XP_011774345.1 hypothetical protein, unlikely [Trypanosoma brucei gambiense DAL972]
MSRFDDITFTFFYFSYFVSLYNFFCACADTTCFLPHDFPPLPRTPFFFTSFFSFLPPFIHRIDCRPNGCTCCNRSKPNKGGRGGGRERTRNANKKPSNCILKKKKSKCHIHIYIYIYIYL